MARLVAASPRRDDIEATLAAGGYAVLVDGPEQAMAVANAIAPEHLELMTADPEALVPLVRHAGAVFFGPVRAGAAWATTWPARATCCPPTARPASPARCGSTTS